MTILRRRWAGKWLLGWITFFMVIALSGCAADHCCPTRGSETSAASARPTPLFQQPQFRGPAPTINVYGELDGMPCDIPGSASTSGLQQHTWLDEGRDNDVAVSPDGKWIVFSSTRHHERGDIYLQRVDGLSVTQLTSDDADDAHPVFSPDGRRIAFCSTRAGAWDIYVMDSDGKNVEQVTSGPMHDMHPSFAPDGRRLVYCSMGSRSGQWELWTVDLVTGQKRMIGFGLFPSWSPDPSRDRIAFQRARARGSRWFSAWTLELVDGEARHVTEITVSTNAAIVSPTWSPDGRRLAFSTIVEPARTASGKPIGQQDIWIIHADGTNRQRLTDGHGINASPFWGADGRVYFISNRSGQDCIWSASAKENAAVPSINVSNDPPSQKHDAVGSVE